MVFRPETGNMAAALTRVGEELDLLLDRRDGDAVLRREQWRRTLDQPLPATGIGTGAVLDELAESIIPNGTRLAEPGFWGWITVAPTTIAVAASAAATLAGPQRSTITAFNLVEEVSLQWLAELCGLGPHMLGLYSSGGSVANLVGLGAARQWAFEQRGVDVAATGVPAAEVAIYTSTEAHHTIQRSAAVLGIGRANVRTIPTDRGQRMRPDLLREALVADIARGVVPIAVVATAGTTNTGAIDPLRAIGEIAGEHAVWFHVDGAYGLPGSLDERVAARYDGLDLADSAIVDPHKWLGAPVGIAATFIRDRSILQRAFTQESAAYLQTIVDASADEAMNSTDAFGIPYADFGVELSSPSRGAVVWAILRELGRDGMAARIREDNDHARHLADRVRAEQRLELMHEPELSICCFRYRADGIDDLDTLNARLLRRLHHETGYIPSSTRVDGHFAIRPCFINSRSRRHDVDGMVEAVIAIGDDLATAG